MSKEVLFLVSDVPPSLNHYLGHRAVCKGKGRGFVSPYTTKEAKDFQKRFISYAKKEVKKQNWNIEKTRDTHFVMECVFYFDKKGRDDQNHYKVISDCLNGIAYIDDKNIIVRTKKVLYDNKNPRVEIKIFEAEYKGIFNSQEHLDRFEENCRTCSRYKRNCSILRKAKEGRVQEEIDMNTYECSKYKEVKQKGL